MDHLKAALHWSVVHWGLCSAIIVSIGGVIAWLRPILKDFLQWRRERDHKKIDHRVMSILETPPVAVVRADQLAEELSLSLDAVAESLNRLETARRIASSGGTLADPRARWHSLFRL